MKMTIDTIEKAITEASPKDQQKLLKDLPKLLRISTTQIGLLKIAENSFQFWNNADDAYYDTL